MTYLILIVLFILVFAFIFWRIFASSSATQAPAAPDKYECTVCNNYHCDCRKENTDD